MKKLLDLFKRKRILRVPSGIVFSAFERDGKKYIKIFDTTEGSAGSICFQIESIDYKNSELNDRFHPETMFEPLKSGEGSME